MLLCTRFGLPDAGPDARTILRWTLEPDRIAAFVAAPVELQNAVTERVASTSGPTGRAILRCIRAGSGQDAAPIGLVCRVLAGPGADDEPRLREAAVRLEPALGGHAIESSAALGWADAAEGLVREMAASGGAKAAGPLIERGDALLREMRAEDFAHRSPVLVSGFEQRLVRCAGALSSFLANPAPGDAEGLRDAADAVQRHDHAATRPDRVEILQMACRLAQRLRQGAAEPGSFSDAATRYAQDGSFADWARTRIWDGDALPAVSDTYRMLSERLAEARARENHRFGALLTEWLALGSSNTDVLPVEEILSQVVAPLAQHVRVLLVIVDAMSFAVLHELAGDLARQGWTELGEGDPGARKVAIAALPSVTEVSRTSLLCGRLRRGTSQDERTGFASQLS